MAQKQKKGLCCSLPDGQVYFIFFIFFSIIGLNETALGASSGATCACVLAKPWWAQVSLKENITGSDTTSELSIS